MIEVRGASLDSTTVFVNGSSDCERPRVARSPALDSFAGTLDQALPL